MGCLHGCVGERMGFALDVAAGGLILGLRV